MAPYPTKIRKRRKGILSEDEHNQAVKRMNTEAAVRRKMGQIKPDVAPQAQKNQAEQIRARANQRRMVKSDGGAVKAPMRGGDHMRSLSGRPQRHETDKGLRRLSFAQAYARRTTDSSRARVLDLYNRTAPPGAKAMARARRHEGLGTPTATIRRIGDTGGRGASPRNVPRPGDSGSRRVHRPVPMPQPGQMPQRGNRRIHQPVQMSQDIAQQVAEARKRLRRPGRGRNTGRARRFNLRG